LKIADIITIHIPLTPETRNLIGKKEFALMRNGVYIINTSRGSIVDEEVLLENLNSGKVAGVGFDVFEIEPPISGFSKSIAEHPKTICTPHIGASTEEAQKKASIIIAEKIVKLMGN
jgi:D-3-phosphoglycerate dehydrogenase